MPRDAQGNAVSAASENAVRAFDHAVQGFLTYRADTAQRLGPMLAADPEFGMAHVLKGCLFMAPFDAAFLPRAREALAEARACLSRAGTGRERAHAEALSFWVEGEIDRALSVWEDVMEEHPRDVLAFRLHHFNAFWTGRPERMLAGVERVLPHWPADLPGWGAVLACRAFANEECGSYVVAEAAGREALALDPGNLWAAHAVAHVMEMQGRRGEGIAFLDGLERHWEGANNLAHHLWWHRAMYHLERREFDAVLGLYDRRFRDLASPLVQAMPDFTTDVQNAASMLFRLELRGVAVGNRWTELADKAEARIGDWLSPFTLPHRMMALAAAGRWAAAERMLEAMREAAAARRPPPTGRERSRRCCATRRCRSARRCWRIGAATSQARWRPCGRRSARWAGSAGATRSRTCWSSFSSTRRWRPGRRRMRGCCWSGWRAGIRCRRSGASAMPRRRGGLRTEGLPLWRRRISAGDRSWEEFPFMHTPQAHDTKTETFAARSRTDLIVIHCADTPAKMDVGATEIRKWHKERGWKDIGYHFVIRRNGEIEKGRHHAQVGAHVLGFNNTSLGICMVGREQNYSEAQWRSLAYLVLQATRYYKGTKVVGHCDLDPVKKKHCPGFDAKAWWAREVASALDGRSRGKAA